MRQRINRKIDAQANRRIGRLFRIIIFVGALPAVGDIVVERDHDHHAVVVIEDRASVRSQAPTSPEIRKGQ